MVFGGTPTTNANDAVTKVHTLRIAANTWTTERATLRTARSSPACGRVGDKVIVAGGRKAGTTEVFDLRTRTFGSLGNFQLRLRNFYKGLNWLYSNL